MGEIGFLLLLLFLIWFVSSLVKLLRKWLSRLMRKIFPNVSDLEIFIKTNIFTGLTAFLLTILYFYITFKFLDDIYFFGVGIIIAFVEVPVLVYYGIMDLITFIKQRKEKAYEIHTGVIPHH